MTGLFTGIINMSITAGYITLAVIAARTLLRKVPKTFLYVLWLPVWMRLILPYSFSSNFSILNIIKPDIQNAGGVIEYIPQNIGLMQKPAIDTGISGINNIVNASLPSAAPVASVNPVQILLWAASVIWMAGIAVIFIYCIFSYIRVRNRVETATLIKADIYESDRISSPFVFGFIKPKVYLPLGLDENELVYIIAHERTHIKRKDHLLKPLAFLILIIHWFNPLIWIAFALMSKDMEMSCDESVLNQMGDRIKGTYANSLLSFSIKRNELLTVNPLAFGESGIKSRIKNILAFKKPAIGAIAIIILVIAVLMVVFASNPSSKQLPLPANKSGYNVEALIANKTPYVGNNSRVIHLIDAMPLPPDTMRDTVELQTADKPYGVTINIKIENASGATSRDVVKRNELYRNSVLLLSLVENADIVKYRLLNTSDTTGEEAYTLTFTRDMAEKLLGGDIRSYSASEDTLRAFIDQLSNMPQIALLLQPQLYEETKLPDFKGNFPDITEQLVYDAAVKKYSNPGQGFTIVAPTILAQYEDPNINKLVVIATVYSNRYRLYGNILSEVGGSIIPAAITFTKNTDNTYTLVEYLEAKDGSYFTSSIKEFAAAFRSEKLYDRILKDYESNENRAELLRKNLIEHLKANNQKDIFLKLNNGDLIPLI